jgi:hypothetical protein
LQESIFAHEDSKVNIEGAHRHSLDNKFGFFLLKGIFLLLLSSLKSFEKENNKFDNWATH